MKTTRSTEPFVATFPTSAAPPLLDALYHEAAEFFDPQRDPFEGEVRDIELRGAALELQDATDREIVLSGPAGTGKTIGVLQKLHKLCLRYPGTRVAFIRKYRVDLTESVLQLFEEEVLPPGHYLTRGPKRENRFKYTYKNGSQIVCVGLDQSTRLFSAKYNFIFVNEAFEIDFNDYEQLLRAMRGFRGARYRQVILDTNPHSPFHWILQRSQQKPGAPEPKLRMLYSYHRDNPFYWNAEKNDWTPEGREYVTQTLEALSGVRRARLLEGRWVSAEGVVYEGYDANVHTVPRHEISDALWATGRRVWSIDWGFWPDPFVWQNWLVDPEGRMYLTQEIYCVRHLIKDLARDIQALTLGQNMPEAIVCDHDSGARATFESEIGMGTLPAYKDIDNGLQEVMERYRVLGDGLARIYYVQGCTLKPDPVLIKAKKPASTKQEKELYIWDEKKDKPVDKNNHGQDAERYAAAYVAGMRLKGGAAVTVHNDVYAADD